MKNIAATFLYFVSSFAIADTSMNSGVVTDPTSYAYLAQITDLLQELIDKSQLSALTMGLVPISIVASLLTLYFSWQTSRVLRKTNELNISIAKGNGWISQGEHSKTPPIL